MQPFHAFGAARGTRRIDDVCQIIGLARDVEILRALPADLRPVAIQAEQFLRIAGQVREPLFLRQMNADAGILLHVGQPVFWIERIKRDPRGPCFQNAQQRNHQFGGALKGNAYRLFLLHSQPLQISCQLTGFLVQFAERNRPAAVNYRCTVRRALRLRQKQLLDGLLRIFRLSSIPIHQQLPAFLLGEYRQLGDAFLRILHRGFQQ